jgi:hypothetical protein
VIASHRPAITTRASSRWRTSVFGHACGKWRPGSIPSLSWEGLIANYQKVIDGYLTGVSDDRLAAASSQLGGNFDGKILDFRF